MNMMDNTAIITDFTGPKRNLSENKLPKPANTKKEHNTTAIA